MHKPRLFISFLLLSMAVTLSAQYTEAWHVLFPYPIYSGEDILLHPNGEMTVCGTSCFTARYDGSGTMLWQTDSLLADTFGYCVKLLTLVDGGTLAVGDYEDHTGTDNLVGLHQDIAGTLLGTTIVDTPGMNTGDEFHDAAQDSQGNVYLTGEFALNFTPSAGLAKLDTNGDLLWQVVLPSPPAWSFAQGCAVGCAGDSLIYVLARNTIGSSLLRYSADGVLLGTTDLDVYIEYNAFAVDEEGNAVFGGDHGNHFNVTKMLPTGAVLWSQDLPSPIPSPSSYISDIACDGNGNIYAAGSAGSLQYGLLTKISPSGTQLWADTTEAYYPVPNYLARHRARMLLQGDRLTLATIYSAAHLYEYDTLGNRLSRQALIVDGDTGPRVNALRKDDEGNLFITGFLPSGQTDVGFLAKYAVDISTGIQQSAGPRPTIFPDPCMDQIQVRGLPDDAAVYVEDANGRTVLNARLHAGALDVGMLPEGPYLLRTPDGSSARFVKVGR